MKKKKTKKIKKKITKSRSILSKMTIFPTLSGKQKSQLYGPKVNIKKLS